MEAITFTQQADGWWKGTLTVGDTPPKVQLEREFVAGENNIVILASMDSLEPAIYERYDGMTDANVLLDIMLPEDTAVTILSKTEVRKAYYD